MKYKEIYKKVYFWVFVAFLFVYNMTTEYLVWKDDFFSVLIPSIIGSALGSFVVVSIAASLIWFVGGTIKNVLKKRE